MCCRVLSPKLLHIFLINLVFAVYVKCSWQNVTDSYWPSLTLDDDDDDHVNGMRLSLNCGHQRACCSFPRWYMSMETHGEIILTGEIRRNRRETCPTATFSAINPTWADPDVNTGPLGLWHGSVTLTFISSNQILLIFFYACPKI
jgi:hypothetical protein